jgi:hypothetical protein
MTLISLSNETGHAEGGLEPDMWIEKGKLMTVGELRRIIRDVPDDWPVLIEHHGFVDSWYGLLDSNRRGWKGAIANLVDPIPAGMNHYAYAWAGRVELGLEYGRVPVLRIMNHGPNEHGRNLAAVDVDHPDRKTVRLPLEKPGLLPTG